VNELWSRLRRAWDNLSPREQLLVASAGGAAAIALLSFTLVMPFLAWSERASQHAETAAQQITTMNRLRREYEDLSVRLDAVEERIRRSQDQPNIRTLLESLAAESAVKISSMEERQAGRNEHYNETKVEVSLRSVTLFQTVKYLHNIEASDRQLSVKSLRIKGRGDNSQLLDVTFSVSSFQPS